MKLKELPGSLYHTFRLKSIPVKNLHNSSKDSLPIIVSLTSIPSRLNKVQITIRSILNQTKAPKKIILWLPETLKNNIPDSLSKLQNDVFEIHYSHLTCSHKKLVHSLKLFPELPITTCDDDFIYNEFWLEKIYNQHVLFPNTIITNQARKICYDADDNLLPYKQWKYKSIQELNSKNILPIGANGVLYPPKAFKDVVFDETLFLELCPKADDLWFKAMALLNNTKSQLSQQIPKEPIPIAGTQKVSLKKENVGLDKNVKQWDAIKAHFNFKTYS